MQFGMVCEKGVESLGKKRTFFLTYSLIIVFPDVESSVSKMRVQLKKKKKHISKKFVSIDKKVLLYETILYETFRSRMLTWCFH